MKTNIIGAIATLTTIGISLPLQAENLSDLNQLLGTKKCPQCDLSGSGLVMANLTGAQLQDANLVSANLSQANLSGANLSGANLTGTDLRSAYLGNTNLTGVDLDLAYLDGIKGISQDAATPEQFHRWGVREVERGNYQAALGHYQKAINLDSEFAPAYLGIGIIQYRFDNRAEGQKNVEIAAKLFEEQEHTLGQQTAQEFQQRMDLIRQAEENVANRERGASNFGKFMGGVGSLLLKLLI